MCPIAMYNVRIAIIVKLHNLYFSLDFFFSSFCKLSIPRLSKPAFWTNFSICEISNFFSSYSTLALFITKLTVAFTMPSCLFKYFSNPLEQALQVIPSIFNKTFFISSSLNKRDTPFCSNS